ncbi:MAG: Unknown protein [uncultured Sulfurovum sp.]|uniref:Leucine-binding protein domain-containing protein n=1 Tax=uncultured Sulfurovum sp. TaxID=269237 RepID=A0A6S6S722_9BACT|nr:MAG: Unknown protein [uncultured Sulfurovum sp.]
MEKKNKPIKHYFKNTFIFIILTIIILFSIDKLFLQSINLKLLKEQRVNYLSTLKDKEPIYVGVVWPFHLKEGDNYFKEGILFAVKSLNAQKLLGREIKVIFKDDKWKIKQAKKIANKFANNKKIVAVIAHDDIDLAVPASITYEYSGIVMISPAVSSPIFTKINFDYVFRNTPSDIEIGQKLAMMADIMNFKKIVVINARDIYAQSLSEVFRQEVLERNLEIIYDSRFNKGEKNFLKIINTLSPLINHNIDYDAIFVAGNETDVPILIKKARENGIYAPFITGDVLDSPALLKIGEAANNTIVATIYNAELISSTLQNFKHDFHKEYKVLPDTWAVQGYDAMMLLAEAIKRANTLHPAIIANQLQYMSNFKSITGSYSLTPKGDTLNKEVYFKVIKNQKFEYLTIE